MAGILVFILNLYEIMDAICFQLIWKCVHCSFMHRCVCQCVVNAFPSSHRIQFILVWFLCLRATRVWLTCAALPGCLLVMFLFYIIKTNKKCIIFCRIYFLLQFSIFKQSKTIIDASRESRVVNELEKHLIKYKCGVVYEQYEHTGAYKLFSCHFTIQNN